jgi:hypothetical protein
VTCLPWRACRYTNKKLHNLLNTSYCEAKAAVASSSSRHPGPGRTAFSNRLELSESPLPSLAVHCAMFARTSCGSSANAAMWGCTGLWPSNLARML